MSALPRVAGSPGAVGGSRHLTRRPAIDGEFDNRPSQPQRRRQPLQAAHDLGARQRGVGQELAMGPIAAPGRAAGRFGQQQVDQVEVEVVKDDPVMEERATRTALRVSGDLAATEGDVGGLDRCAVDGQRGGQPAEQPRIAALDVGQPGTPVQ